MNTDEASAQVYKVVANHEEQYSIWPVQRENAPGWRDAGPSGSKEDCLAFIEKTWTDMRPLSLRQAMMENASRDDVLDGDVEAPAPTESLVDRLSRGRHAVTAILGDERSPAQLKERIDAGYVEIRFTETKGGTELGLKLTRGTDTSAADFAVGSGNVHLEGELVLDFVQVRCIADVDLATLSGEAFLEPLER